MKRINSVVSLLFAATVALLPSLKATPVVQVLGAGSSAQLKTTAIGAFLNLAGGKGSAHHWTKNGKTTGGNNFAQLHDTRSASIPNEGGTVWIVWDNAHTKVWAYLSVDSVVGNRAYFARDAAGKSAVQLQLDPSVQSTPGQNLISAALFGGQADDTAVPVDVFTALNNSPITAGFTD